MSKRPPDAQQRRRNDARSKLTAMFDELISGAFFGEVTVTFQNGHPHQVRVHRSYRLDELGKGARPQDSDR